jgi:hypothetical protein
MSATPSNDDGVTVALATPSSLEHYRKRYQSEGKEMGKLDFPEETIEVLGDPAMVHGRWRLALSGGKGGASSTTTRRRSERPGRGHRSARPPRDR